MKFSISARIAEGFLSKREPIMSLPDLVTVAKSAGYDGLCMRASQIGVHTPEVEVTNAAKSIHEAGLSVTMISGDFDIVYNNDEGPNCLRNITPYLDLAQELGAGMIRVCIKTEEDIAYAQRASDEAAERNLKLVHQCHIQSLFETVDQIFDRLKEINRNNFGLIYEAANLEECRQAYGADTIRRFGRKIFNVYLQNQRINKNGAVTLDTWSHGLVSFDLIDIPDDGGIRFVDVFEGLRDIGYDGVVTVHQSAPTDPNVTPEESARRTREFLRSLQ